ncbi:hydroxyacylglutathione hydrolase [Psychrobacter aestuarii]|uniref:Hydroxyacylglutathione hydrolase n=1 Tax=Psychrobacter aestuarii TaxID=556327 RepID=A0ABP3FCT9_9GAMM|nr:hydroxyacylglutathione hydrolase [Psychrobacter aestuarii]
MSIRIQPVNALKDNYIWIIINDSNGQAIIIDPGEAAPVINYLTEQSLEPIAIWITHRHYDHVDGVAELQETYPMIHVVAHSEHPVTADQTIKDGSTVNAWGRTAQVWGTEGHTEHHVSYILDVDGRAHCFCGDTLFSGGCGRILSGTAEMLYNSLSRLSELPDDALLYPAHEYTAANLRFGRTIEPENAAIQQALIDATEKTEQHIPTLPVTVAHEQAINVFLRTDEDSVIAGVEAKTQLPDTRPVTVFAALRALKDNF